jgi:hypothetical protein
MIIKVIDEAGHFALVETEAGFAIQFSAARVNQETRGGWVQAGGIASRIGTDHDLKNFENLESAKKAFNSQQDSLLAEFAKWGTN